MRRFLVAGIALALSLITASAAQAARTLSAFTIGHTLPRGSTVAQVTLDGSPASYTTVVTNRGVEVLVTAPTSGTHELVVTTS
jgi:hypothetical protein